MQRITGYVSLEETTVRGGSENSSAFKRILRDPGAALARLPLAWKETEKTVTKAIRESKFIAE